MIAKDINLKKKFIRRRKSRHYYPNKYSWYNSQYAVPLAEQALKTAKWVATLVNAESKYDDTTVTNTAYDFNGVIATMCNPAQGTTAITRTGDSIKMQNMTLRGYVYNNAASSVTRVIVFYDKDNTITNVSDYLQSTGSALATESPKNEDNKFKTKTLLDKSITLSLTGEDMKKFSYVIKIGKHTDFVATTSTISSGALKMIIISNQTSGASSPNVTYYSRVTYLDN